MHILLLIVYAALAGIGIWKIPFLRKSGIRPRWLWLLFALHVLTGWAHNWIAYRYFPDHGDIWNYFTLSFLYRHRLLSEFHLFLSDNSTWTYITHNGIVYIQMLLDLLSADDMNINTLLFAFPVFLGNVALFRVFRRRFPDDSLAATSVFWLPSVMFWTACIYREGMLYMLLGFLLYHLDQFAIRRRRQPFDRSPIHGRHSPLRPDRRALFYAIFIFLLIAYFRIAVAVILIPAALIYCALRFRKPRPWILGAVFLVLVLLTIMVPGIRDPVLHAVTTEQSSFQLLEGHSRLPLPTLDGTPASVWRTLPAAIRNGFFEPLPGLGGQPIYLAFSLELIFIWLVVLAAAIRFFTPKPAPATPGAASHSSSSPGPSSPGAASPSPAFPAACLLFALAGMLTIGFFVPFAGTIIRYRSIYLPFLLAPTLHTLRYLRPIQPLNRWLINKL